MSDTPPLPLETAPLTGEDRRELRNARLLRNLQSRRQTENYRWNGPLSVLEGLLREGSRFEFVQVMRLLTAMAAEQVAGSLAPSIAATAAAAEPALPMVQYAPEAALLSAHAGASQTMDALDAPRPRLAVRLRSRISMNFPAASVHRVSPSTDTAGEVEVIANLMALAGMNAPLPEPFAELLLEQQKARNLALTDFLDLFHHRLLELYFAGSIHTAPWLAMQHPANNELAQMVYAIAGLGPADLREQMQVPDRVWLRYAGLLWHRPRSAVGLQRILSDHFKTTVRLGATIGRWQTIEPEDRSRLGRGSCRLGSTATLGKQVWVRTAGIRLRVGPLNRARFEQFLPRKKAYRQMLEMVRFYLEDQVSVELELLLDAGSADAARLGRTRLGWGSWMCPDPELVTEAGPMLLRLRPGGSLRGASKEAAQRR
jgi:type VI secretion system protein ImpH